jgi:2-polyprenyl-3-methyl-5-hydroxy-6-metoxy-1,4-benzoquinol methylase
MTAPQGAAERLHDVAGAILDAKLPDYDPWLYRYCGELAAPEDAERYLRYQLDHLALGRVDLAGKRVLDVGCGFGMALITCGILGARELRGVDAYRPMIDTVHAYQPLLPGYLRERLEVVVGDASAMPYEDESFDVLLSIEAISHYLDVPGFIDEAARVLRPGGVMIVSDGNNGRNRKIRSETQEIWEAFELGSSNGGVHGHEVKESYVQKRERIARAAAPGIDAAAAREIARMTFGMVEDDVAAAAREHAASGAMPSSPYRRGEVPVNPNGQVIERLFDPYELASDIEERGFRARAHGYWGGASGRASLRVANRVLDALSRVTIHTARGFRLVAVKRTT